MDEKRAEEMVKILWAVKTIKLATEKEIGYIDRDVFRKSLDKAKRFMVAAYGSEDFEQFIDETGGSIACFVQETLAKPDGLNTFNRKNSI